MATVLSTLYPPSVSTFQNAFINSDNAIVYFSLSAYNSRTDFNYVHISCVDQTTNENALSAYAGLLVKEPSYDKDSGMYYVTIPCSALNSSTFNINQFYKVQIRLDNSTIKDVPSMSQADLNSYLLNHTANFSEWSSVCLIRPISKPEVVLNVFENWTGSKDISFNQGQVNFSGVVSFEADNETETLQSYQIFVLNKKSDIELSSSTVYTSDNVNPNVINYNFDFSSLNNEDAKYILKIKCLTKNQYSFEKTYNFIISDYNEDSNWSPSITATVDDDRGYVTIHVTNPHSFVAAQTLYIRRASSVDNFLTWENLYVKSLHNIDVTITDNTVSSLVWYKYKVELANSLGVFYSNNHKGTSSTVLPQFYDAIFSRGTKQLPIKYDYKVTSLKPMVSRTKVDTLGGKYPKFTENAVLGYKQFGISGVISSEMDVFQQFLSKNNVYTDNLLSFYSSYKTNSGVKDLVRNDVGDWEISSGSQYPVGSIPTNTSSAYRTTTQNDWMWEREFREQVVSWLNDGEPKLYRSMAEGSMVVMLTDVSLTPKTQLGRRIWDFSATVYEVEDAASIETLDSLGIYTVPKVSEVTSGSDDDDDSNTVIKPYQIYNYTIKDSNLTDENEGPAANTNICDFLRNKLEIKMSGSNSNKTAKNVSIKDVRIYFTNQPRLCDFSKKTLTYLTFDNNTKIDSNALSKYRRGYIFTLGEKGAAVNKTIFVNERGYYQIPNDVEFNYLSFKTGDNITIEGLVTYDETINSNEIISGIQIDKTVVGQYQDVFEVGVSYGDTIREKYTRVITKVNGTETTVTGNQSMKYWKGISLEVTPYAVFQTIERGDIDYQTFEVGSTGVYNILSSVPIEDIRFLGIRVKKSKSNNVRYVQEYEYVDYSDVSYELIDDIPNIVDHGVYNIQDELKIYYNSNWYDFTRQSKDTTDNANDATTEIGIIGLPIEGVINYYGQVVTEQIG